MGESLPMPLLLRQSSVPSQPQRVARGATSVRHVGIVRKAKSNMALQSRYPRENGSVVPHLVGAETANGSPGPRGRAWCNLLGAVWKLSWVGK